ncbi:LysM peptidoglycan-binding domain-containing protein [bacterium]|nr:LysM peptidoglycan-binding domain-containing protein [bacterium]
MTIFLQFKKILLKTSKLLFSGIFTFFSGFNKNFYNKFLLPVFLLPLYNFYRRLSKDTLIGYNSSDYSRLEKFFLIFLNRKFISYFIIFIMSFFVFSDSLSLNYKIDRDVEFNDSIFFNASRYNNDINSVIVDDNKVLEKNNSLFEDASVDSLAVSEPAVSDVYLYSDDITYYVFDNSTIIKPNLSNLGLDFSYEESEDDGISTDSIYYSPSKKTYVVKEGDTLSEIASNFNISLKTLLYENEMTSSSVIKPGSKLTILPFTGVSHIVKYGDTLNGLAYKYDISVSEIKKNNYINGDLLRLGQSLLIPTEEVPNYVSTPTYVASTPSSSSSSLYPKVSPVSGDGTLKAHIFPYGQCTWYVATRRFVPWGGHAKYWLKNSQQYGYSIGYTPVKGAIVVTNEHVYYGHVAYVEDVDDSYIYISEMNYIGWGVVGNRKIPINSSRIIGYIY